MDATSAQNDSIREEQRRTDHPQGQESDVKDNVPGRCVLESSVECDTKQLLLLPCLHNVCKPCLSQHQNKNIVCKCGEKIDTGEGHLLADYVKENKTKLDKKTTHCGYLRSSCLKTVVSYCTVCDVSLCTDCQENHDQISLNASHDVISLESNSHVAPWSPRYSTCTNHHEQKVLYLDKNCKKAICNVCYTGFHAGHEVRALETEYEEGKKTITKILKNHELRLKQFRELLKQRRDRLITLQQEKSDLETQMTSTHENIILKQQERQKYHLQKMRNDSAKLKEDIQEDIKSLCKRQTALEETISYGTDVLEFTSAAEFLELLEVIVRKASRDLDETLPDQGTVTKRVVFTTSGLKALDEVIAMFGDVRYANKDETDEDPIPTLTDLQMKYHQLQKDNDSLTDTITKCKQVTAYLAAAVKEKGIYVLDQEKLDLSYLLHCIHLEFDRTKVNLRAASLNKEGELWNDCSFLGSIAHKTRVQLKNYMGTCSTTPVFKTGSPQYWETVSTVFVDTTVPESALILEIGLSRENERDQGHYTSGHLNSYSLMVVHCKKHKSICRRVWSHGLSVYCLPNTMPNVHGTAVILHYGIVYDDTRGKLAFLDINKRTLLAVLDDLDSSYPLWPMFGLYCYRWVNVGMKLLVGQSIHMPREKKALILKALG